MDLTLGYRPHVLHVEVTSGVMFWSTIVFGTPEDPLPWPDGAIVELRHILGTWTAVIDDTKATWTESDEDVDEILAEEDRSVRLWYSDAETEEIVWASGHFMEVATND